jgi:uncharacterized membrane protein
MTNRRFQVPQVSLVLTLIGLGITMAISISVFVLFLNIPISYYEVMGWHSKSDTRQATDLAAGNKQDIYYIVLDGTGVRTFWMNITAIITRILLKAYEQGILLIPNANNT